MSWVTSSWLRPGTWLENLELAAGLPWIGGMELLFFEYDGETRRLLAAELAGIAAAARRLSLSVHLPDPLGDSALELCGLLAPHAGPFVLHPPREGEEARWSALVATLRGRHGERFLLEYTGRAAFALGESILPGIPLCADTGRLLLDGEAPADWIGARADRVREIHLHGAGEGKDHLPLGGEEAWLPTLLPLLDGAGGGGTAGDGAAAGDPALARTPRVVLELFSLEAAAATAAALDAALARRAQADAAAMDGVA